MFAIYLASAAIGIALLVYLRIPRGDRAGFRANDKLNPYNRSNFTGEPLQVRLSKGVTQYYLCGPESGPKVILVHGITVPAVVFKDVAKTLGEKGYRVLAYDIYGRGYSSGPDDTYNKILYVGQLFELCKKLEWENFYLVGFSLGGAICAAFTATYPQLVSKLALIAPAGLFAPNDVPFFARIMKIPLLGELVAYTVGKTLIMFSSTLSFNNNSESSAKEIKSIRNYQIQNHPGYLRAYFSTLRHFPISGLDKEYETIEKSTQIPVMVQWGDNDKVVPFKLSSKLRSIIPRANVITLTGGDHHCLNEQTDIVTKNLLDYFSSKN